MPVMNKSSLLLQILVIAIREVGGKEIQQKCGPRQYRCGDVCTFDQWSCSCGDVTLSNKYSPDYCCTAPGGQCTYDYINIAGDAVNPVCSGGQPVPRSETCNGACHEDSPANTTDADGHTTCDCPNEDGWTNKASSCSCGNFTISKKVISHMANSGTVPGPGTGTHLPVSHQSDTGTASLDGHMNVLCHAIIVHTYCA